MLYLDLYILGEIKKHPFHSLKEAEEIVPGRHEHRSFFSTYLKDISLYRAWIREKSNDVSVLIQNDGDLNSRIIVSNKENVDFKEPLCMEEILDYLYFEIVRTISHLKNEIGTMRDDMIWHHVISSSITGVIQ